MAWEPRRPPQLVFGTSKYPTTKTRNKPSTENPLYIQHRIPYALYHMPYALRSVAHGTIYKITPRALSTFDCEANSTTKK
ncbi:hypothetical protein ACN38_g649 [Penicillium nordicum]|uniref:Uncharacterized protein n=1 Tax=Penicillium nordicum TaxID=229535 RepID=A0A0M8PIL4_9EURO|nr:hypothetical protein ACN38_g649 [Penicillium nordicum]